MVDLLQMGFWRGLAPATKSRLKALITHRRQVRPGDDIARDGEVPADAQFVLEGFACRYKHRAGGQRAVLAYLLPGDFCGITPDLGAPLDHYVGCVTACTVASVPRTLWQEVLADHPSMAWALSAALTVEGAIQRQWLANMGCAADQRLAHLLCELRARLSRAGLADHGGFSLPLTQQELGEALSLSTVHVNRTLQHLKDMGLVRVMDRRVVISDLSQLESFAEFDPGYLGMAATRGTRIYPAG